MWWFNVTWPPGWDPRIEKRHWVKSEEIRVKHGQFKSNILILVHLLWKCTIPRQDMNHKETEYGI
jgi:hypothetical protein